MTKYFKLNYSNGESYLVPAEYYAKDRADYYASRDAKRDGLNYDDVFAEEVAYAMDDESILDDWIRNNTDWSQVKSIAIRLPDGKIKFDYQEEYCNGENHEFVEIGN